MTKFVKEHFSISKKGWIIKGALCVLFVLISLFFVYIFGQLYDRPAADEYLVYTETTGETGYIGEADLVTQTFTSPFNTLRVLSVKPLSNMADVNIMYVVRLYENDELIVTRDFKTQELQTDTFNILEVPLTDAKDKEYRIEISLGRTTEDKSVPFALMASVDGFESAYYNGEKLSAPLAINLNTVSTGQETYVVVLVLLALAIIAVVLLVGKNQVINVAVIILIFGSFMAVLNPVGDSPDERAHYLRAESLSQGRVFTEATTPLDADASILKLLDDASTERNQFYKFSDAHMYDLKVGEGTTTTLTGTSGNYIFFAYIPSAIGLLLSKLLNLSAMVAVYLCRIINVCVYAALASLAVYLTPKLKNTFAFLVCFPFCVYFAASFNSDLVTFGIAFVLAAYLYKLFCQNDGTVSIYQTSVFAFLAMCLALTKIPYILFIPLILLLPKSRYKTKKHYLATWGAIAVACAICLVWLALSGAAGLRPADGANAKLQIMYILQHPGRAINTILTAFFEECTVLYGQWFTLGWLSYNFAWMGFVVPFVAYNILTGETLKEKEVFALPQKAYAGLIVAAIIPVTYLAMYISTMHVSAATVIGIQGRYILPIISMLPLLLAKPNNNPSRKTNVLTAPLWSTGLLVVCISYIILRHYL